MFLSVIQNLAKQVIAFAAAAGLPKVYEMVHESKKVPPQCKQNTVQMGWIMPRDSTPSCEASAKAGLHLA